MDFVIKILTWLLGIIALAAGIFYTFLFTELKILVFDKSLSTDEKKEIKNELKWLYTIPIILAVAYFLFSLNQFFIIVCLLVFFFLFAFIFQKGKKDRKEDKLTIDKKLEGIKDFVEDGKDIGDDIHKHLV